MNKNKLKELLRDDTRVFNVRRDPSKTIVDKDFIKKLRVDCDLTQLVFSSILGVSVKTIEKWEQGSVEPRPITKKFLYLLDIHPELLNDLYSFASHESYAIEHKPGTSFEKAFSVKTFDKSSVAIDFENEQTRFTPEIENNDLISKDCCPAS
jgi:DNA-binding transcriptional regulator YiaG